MRISEAFLNAGILTYASVQKRQDCLEISKSNGSIANQLESHTLPEIKDKEFGFIEIIFQ
jgi:hypothetical protein